jgi:predicted amidohydrolase
LAETTLAAANVAVTHDKAANLRRLTELIYEAGSNGADILVLPEVGLQGYPDFGCPAGGPGETAQKQYYYREAETIPGPATRVVQEAAGRYGMTVQLGLAERSLHGNVIFNTAAVIDGAGVKSVFRKIHNQFEHPYFSPGENTPTFRLPHCRAASLICYDLVFPELSRVYALQGATVILMSTAWVMKGHDKDSDYYGWAMDIAVQANAFFNQLWFVVSDHCETGAGTAGVDYYGRSKIVDPFGRVVAVIDGEEGLVTHTADLQAEVLRSRTEGFDANLLQDRRPQHYAALTDLRPYHGDYDGGSYGNHI